MDLLDRLPERFKSRRTADAVMAPSAIVAGGAGAAAAILFAAPLAAVVGLGALAYAGVVALRLPHRARAVRIDPRSISEPWGSFVDEALDAQRRFAETARSVPDGPVRERLGEIGNRIDTAVQECWRVARRGAALDHGVASLELSEVRSRLKQTRSTRPNSPAGVDSRDRTVEALEAQLSSGERIETVATNARDRLRLLDARLDEAVARAVELSFQADDVSVLVGLGDDVEQLIGENTSSGPLTLSEGVPRSMICRCGLA